METLKIYLWDLLGRKLLVKFRDKTFYKNTRTHKIIRNIFLPARYTFGWDLFDFNMSDTMAMRIYELRMNIPNHSWRRIAEVIHEEYPEFDVSPGCQMDGKWLCEYAAVVLEVEID